VDLKAFSERFYHDICAARLQPVLDTLVHIARDTTVWLELTTLLIPGENDGDDELHAMTRWVVENLGPDVPMHFTAFHPDWRMLDRPPTPPATLARARRIALANGVRYAYTGNVRDIEGGTTFCHHCGEPLIERDGYDILGFRLTPAGACPRCGTRCAGVFEARPGTWGSQRRPVRLAATSEGVDR
jgi:pyruvate formate lyase activating enzyme